MGSYEVQQLDEKLNRCWCISRAVSDHANGNFTSKNFRLPLHCPREFWLVIRYLVAGLSITGATRNNEAVLCYITGFKPVLELSAHSSGWTDAHSVSTFGTSSLAANHQGPPVSVHRSLQGPLKYCCLANSPPCQTSN